MDRKQQLHLVPLRDETRDALPTQEAAAHLSLSTQTLYNWNLEGTYPACLKPIKLPNGRLRWPVAGIRAQLGIGEAA